MKYMGSKSRIAKYIVPIIQECIDDNDISTYLEPFCGGCNIIDKIKANKKIASDKNKYLIALWKQEVGRSIKANDKSKSVEKLFTYNQGLYFDYINRKD